MQEKKIGTPTINIYHWPKTEVPNASISPEEYR